MLMGQDPQSSPSIVPHSFPSHGSGDGEGVGVGEGVAVGVGEGEACAPTDGIVINNNKKTKLIPAINRLLVISIVRPPFTKL